MPTSEELATALKSHDLYLYFGHGSGMLVTIAICCMLLVSCYSFCSFALILDMHLCAFGLYRGAVSFQR